MPRSRASSIRATSAPIRPSASGCRLAVPGVDPALLDPRATWADPDAYDRKARELADMFITNFERFEVETRSAKPASA